MTSPEPAKCRSCKAPVLWCVTKTKGKAIPLNLEPDPEGNMVVELPDDPRADLIARPARPSEKLIRYMPHHAVCPDAASWRTVR